MNRPLELAHTQDEISYHEEELDDLREYAAFCETMISLHYNQTDQ